MAFATTDDVQTRLGQDLTDAEESTAELVIEVVTGLIASEVNRGAAWAAALTPVPALFRALCVEKAVSVICNPRNVASYSKALGQASKSETFPRSQDLGIFLSDREGQACRFALYGSTTGSARVDSVLEDYYCS